jgi:hypothetical protein
VTVNHLVVGSIPTFAATLSYILSCIRAVMVTHLKLFCGTQQGAMG